MMKFLQFGQNVQISAFKQFLQESDQVLMAAGFAPLKKQRSWSRKSNWKVETVYLTCRGNPVEMFLPNLAISVPSNTHANGIDRYRFMIQENVERVVPPFKRPAEYVQVPSVDLMVGRFVRKNVELIDASLQWFQKYSTPTEALKLLRAGELDVLKGSEQYREIEEFLKGQIGADHK